jgi:hypothetical protein
MRRPARASITAAATPPVLADIIERTTKTSLRDYVSGLGLSARRRLRQCG